MDTNLIELIIAIILFIAVLIFDFAFFRFRERKFDESEPLSFLINGTVRSLKGWVKTLRQPKPGEMVPLEEESHQPETDFAVRAKPSAKSAIDPVLPTQTVVAPPEERPMVHVSISADVPEGTVVHITMQVTDADGKILVQNGSFTSKSPARTLAPKAAVAAQQPKNIFQPFLKKISGLKNNLRSLNFTLFWGSIIAYALIVSFAIDQWPIYFFTDEAVHMNMASDFLRNGLQNYDDEFLPTFFIKEVWVHGVSVYLQVLPYLIFGKSVVVIRLVSTFITLIGAIALGLLLKNVFKTKYYWAGVFLLLTTPAWFLHARTAFEYAEVSSFYCLFLYFYSRYRKGDMRSLYIAMIAGALCFYTHGLGQLLTGTTALALFIVDFRYHIHPKRRKAVLLGVVLAIILFLPYVRYYLGHPDEIARQVKIRNSYWTNSSLSLPEKILDFLTQYFYGLNPMYWYAKNNIDFDRHVMVGPGIANGLLITLPFVIVGFFQIFKTIRKPLLRFASIALITIVPILVSGFIHIFTEDGAWRTQLILPQLGPGTVIPFDASSWIPVEIVINMLWVALACMLVGLFLAFTNIRKSAHKVVLIALLACPVPASVAAVGMPRMLWMSVPLAILAAIGLSAVVQWLEKRLKFRSTYSAVGLFAALLVLSLFILRTGIVDGPLWFQDYGLYGMQFGAKEVFQQTLLPAMKENPSISFVVSPSWANGTEQFTDFFIPRELQPRMRLGQPIDLIDNQSAFATTQFITTAPEYDNLMQDPKFNGGINVLKIINYPNGQPGFYLLEAKPAGNIADIMNEQHAANRTPIEDTMDFNGQATRVRYSPLGSGNIADIFDNDPDTLTRVLEANPFYIDLYPVVPIDTNSVVIKTGSLHNYTITIRLYPVGGGQAVEYIQTFQDEPGKDLPPDPEVTINFDKGPGKSSRVEIEIKDNLSGETSSIHTRMILFK